MKPISLHVLTLLGTILCGSANAGNADNSGSVLSDPTPDRAWKATLNAGFETLHVYRGVDSSSGEANVWESLDVDVLNFFHFNLYNGNSPGGEYGELTPSAYIYKDLGFATISTGMIWYHFPGEEGVDSEEYFINLSRQLGAGFSASAWFSYNARSEGWYHELKVNHLYSINDRLSVETYGALGYSQDYRSGGNGLDNLTLAVGLPVKITESLTLKPSVGYAFALDALDSDNEAWGALTLSYSF